jgi:cysteine desulfurase / selenocysteine lyase
MKTSLDNVAIRREFPFFTHNPAVTYLDSASTAQKPQAVIDAISDYYSLENAPAHRSAYFLAEDATGEYESRRRQIAKFINASYEEVVFTKGATDGINIVAASWASMVEQGDAIVATTAEHHANLIPWQRLAAQKNAVLTLLPFHLSDERILERLESCIGPKTKLVACTMDSNVLGPVSPALLQAIVTRAHQVGARVLFDAAQAAPHQQIDVQALGCDFLVFSGHKLYAPTASGVLYIRSSEHKNLVPVQVGGGMVKQVQEDACIWERMPHMLEAGTPALTEIIGLGVAIEELQKWGSWEERQAYEQHLIEHAIKGISKLQKVRIIGNPCTRQGAHLFCFTVDTWHPHEVAGALGDSMICVRGGYHCAEPIHKRFGAHQGSTRVSCGIYNNIEEIDTFIAKVKEITERPDLLAYF